MDSLEFNKIIAGVLGAVLTLLLFTWVGDLVYGIGEGGHDDEHHLAFEIELPESGEGEVVVEAGPSIGELLLSASAADGESQFRPCKACHVADTAENKVGPFLLNVVGRDVASADGFGGYSDALLSMDGDWTAEALSGFLEKPSAYAPGTAMNFAGIRDADDRADLIAYLVSVSGQTLEDFIVLPEAAPAEEAAIEEAAATDAHGETVAETHEEPAVDDHAAPAAEAVEEAPVEAAPTETSPAEDNAVEEEADEAAVDTTEIIETAAADLPAFMSGAVAEQGERLFRACRACHSLDEGRNGTGPSLHGIVNRDIASVEGFNYSAAMANMPGTWTAEQLNEFIEAPRATVAGTRMSYAGMRDQADRANLIAYLATAAQ